jgi:hypothetical protein
MRLKCDGASAETRFRLSAKLTSPFESAEASVQSTAGSRGVRISGSNAGCTMFRGSVKSTGYRLHSPVSPSLLLPCVTVCHHISTGLYFHVFLTSARNGSEWSAPRLGRIAPGKVTRYPLSRKVGGPQSRCGCYEENKSLGPTGMLTPDRPGRSLVSMPKTNEQTNSRRRILAYLQHFGRL